MRSADQHENGAEWSAAFAGKESDDVFVFRVQGDGSLAIRQYSERDYLETITVARCDIVAFYDALDVAWTEKLDGATSPDALEEEDDGPDEDEMEDGCHYLRSSWYRDRRVRSVSSDARLLLLAAIAEAAAAKSDGFFDEDGMDEVAHYAGVAPEEWDAVIRELVGAGLLELIFGGYRLHVSGLATWERSAGVNGFRTESARNPNGIHPDSVEAAEVKS